MSNRKRGKGSKQTEADPAKIGRPPKLVLNDETIKQIGELGRIQCTQREAAAVLGVHEETLRLFFGAHEKAREAWEIGRDNGLASLRRNQFKTAETNPTMQIWLGKQYLDQKDKSETSLTVTHEDALDTLE